MTNPALIAGATLTAIAALAHIGCIVFGAPWYRFFGAGEGMAQLAMAGSIKPTLITLGIASVLGIWSLYALSGAGIISRLPLLRLALCAITGIYLLRGIAGLILAIAAPGERSIAFWCWSSAICLGIGVLHLIGTKRAWAQLSHSAG